MHPHRIPTGSPPDPRRRAVRRGRVSCVVRPTAGSTGRTRLKWKVLFCRSSTGNISAPPRSANSPSIGESWRPIRSSPRVIRSAWRGSARRSAGLPRSRTYGMPMPPSGNGRRSGRCCRCARSHPRAETRCGPIWPRHTTICLRKSGRGSMGPARYTTISRAPRASALRINWPYSRGSSRPSSARWCSGPGHDRPAAPAPAAPATRTPRTSAHAGRS